MRRYFITERCVLTRVMPMPRIIMKTNSNNILEVSCSTLKSGTKLSMSITVPQMAAMAISAAIKPLMMALTLIGFAMNHLVAPTICMVLIKKRLLYIARRMVLSIEKTTSMVKMMAAIRKMIAAVFTYLLILVTVSVGN